MDTMEKKELLSDTEFRKDLRKLAVPVTLQCLLQSSFSVVDQVMTGQLGSVSIAAVGLSGKFISLLTVMVQAIAAVAGIILAQAIGKKDTEATGKGFYTNLLLALALALGFTVAAILLPEQIMSIYSQDRQTVTEAAVYLSIYAVSFLFLTVTSLFSAYLRCAGRAAIPLYAGICSAVLNTGLNYLLIFGKGGFPRLGIKGAALASVISQAAGAMVILVAFAMQIRKEKRLFFGLYTKLPEWKNYLYILVPMFICDFFWVLGENVYAFIYGHVGTLACAAMTLINPVVSLMIGALSGVAQAAGIMVGRLLGEGEKEKAYVTAKKLMKTGLAGSVLLSVLLLMLNSCYVRIFRVEQEVRNMTRMILMVFAVISPIKVQNMIMGGGILRSGGKTNYVMGIDLIGTWVFGVPLGLLAAFICKLPIAGVYFLLSLEEVVRLLISLVIFRQKNWMRTL